MAGAVVCMLTYWKRAFVTVSAAPPMPAAAPAVVQSQILVPATPNIFELVSPFHTMTDSTWLVMPVEYSDMP